MLPLLSLGFQNSPNEASQENQGNLTVEILSGEGSLLEGISSAAILAIREGLYDTIMRLDNPENPAVFENVPFGSYLVAVEHEDPFYWPTYYGNEVEWIRADTLRLMSDSVIQIYSYESAVVDLGGSGVLDLTVEESFDGVRKRAKERICYLKRRRLDDDSFDPFRPISFGRTDASGQYQWEQVPEGTYRISLEYPGLEGFLQFEVTEDDLVGACDTPADISAFVTESGIEIEFLRILPLPCLGSEHSLHQIKVYPNPVQDMLFLEVPTDAKANSIEMADLTGKVVWRKSPADFESLIAIPVAQFSKGVHFLRIMGRNKVYVSEQIVIE